MPRQSTKSDHFTALLPLPVAAYYEEEARAWGLIHSDLTRWCLAAFLRRRLDDPTEDIALPEFAGRKIACQVRLEPAMGDGIRSLAEENGWTLADTMRRILGWGAEQRIIPAPFWLVGLPAVVAEQPMAPRPSPIVQDRKRTGVGSGWATRKAAQDLASDRPLTGPGAKAVKSLTKPNSRNT